MSSISLVVARADNGVIGRDGRLPWHLPADLRRFKQLTMGTAMIMGRKTFESLPGLLPGRRHIVLTRSRDWNPAGAVIAHDPEQAILLAGGENISVIGGAEIYRLFLPLADRVELTEVHASPEGDTVLPAFEAADWRESGRERHEAEGTAFAFSFVTLEKAAR